MSMDRSTVNVAPPEVILSARNIEKRFGAVQALKEVNFDIYRGQVTTLFGENGAGKSTLMKILSGVIAQTAGEIVLEGECLSIPHRVLVMSKGRISAEFKPGVTKDEIMAASGESVAA